MVRAGVLVLVGLMLVVCGCDRLRWAPSEAIRQNSVLQRRTTTAMVWQAKQEQASPVLQSLAQRAARQSEVVLAYTGYPKALPASESLDDLLGEQSQAITAQAQADGQERPDVWQVTDSVFELGLALAGLVGGVYGTRVVRTIKQLRGKSQALKEIVSGNELFKRQHPEAKAFFKEAHASQSVPTRTLVTEMTP